MRPRTTFTLACCFLSAMVIGQYQEVISAAGNSFENSSGSISFTLGESITSTFISGDIILTQGFHQSKLIIVNNREIPFPDFKIEVFPNPAHEYIIVQMDDPAGFTYKLIDMHGRILKVGEIMDREYEIDLTELPASMYIINLYRDDNETASFKIIKR